MLEKFVLICPWCELNPQVFVFVPSSVFLIFKAKKAIRNNSNKKWVKQKAVITKEMKMDVFVHSARPEDPDYNICQISK